MLSSTKHPHHKFIKNFNFNEYLKWRCSKQYKMTQTSYLLSIENLLISKPGPDAIL